MSAWSWMHEQLKGLVVLLVCRCVSPSLCFPVFFAFTFRMREQIWNQRGSIIYEVGVARLTRWPSCCGQLVRPPFPWHCRSARHRPSAAREDNCVVFTPARGGVSSPFPFSLLSWLTVHLSVPLSTSAMHSDRIPTACIIVASHWYL